MPRKQNYKSKSQRTDILIQTELSRARCAERQDFINKIKLIRVQTVNILDNYKQLIRELHA